MSVLVGWLVTAVYVVGFVGTWRRVAWFMAHDGGIKPDGFDVAFAILMGALASLAWPIIVPIYFIYRSGLLIGPGHAFLRPPRSVAREHELREREQRIERMERELGIGSK